MERRRALAIAGALTAVLLTGTVAAGAVGGFFGFTSAESGATPATTGATPSSRPVVTVHVPGPAPDDPTAASSGLSPRVAARTDTASAGGSVGNLPAAGLAAAPASPAAPVAAPVNVVSPAPVPADHEAEPVGEDPPAASPEERDDEHEGEHDNEPGDDEHEFDD